MACDIQGTNGGFPKLGVPFWGPYNKDYSILGSILGSYQILMALKGAANHFRNKHATSPGEASG